MSVRHSIKVNGKWYQAGEEIVLDKSKNKEAVEKHYTKTEINRMSTTELQKLSATNGIENAFDMSGNELKKVLIQHFEL